MGRLVEHAAEGDEAPVRGLDCDLQVTPRLGCVEHPAPALELRLRHERVALVVEAAPQDTMGLGPVVIVGQIRQAEAFGERDRRELVWDVGFRHGTIELRLPVVATGPHQRQELLIVSFDEGPHERAAIFLGPANQVGLGIVEHVLAQMAIGGMELEEDLPQAPFVMGCGGNLPIHLPDPHLSQGVAVQQAVVVHVLPGGFDPVSVPISRLVMPDEEITHAFVIVGWR